MEANGYYQIYLTVEILFWNGNYAKSEFLQPALHIKSIA